MSQTRFYPRTDIDKGSGKRRQANAHRVVWDEDSAPNANAWLAAAAAIATAFVARDPLEIFETAIKFVPRRSRFHRIARDSLDMVRNSSDWLDGYERIHGKYKEYEACQIYQEIGTVMNTLRFAADIGDGICKQVSQGNDTDSFGCTCGSILGAFHGPDRLDPRWLAPFHDTIHVAMAACHEPRLSAVARRMGQLPARLRN